MKGLADLQALVGSGEVSEKPKKEKETKLSTKADKFDQLTAVAKTLNKQLDTTMSIVKLGEKVGQPIPSISTGLPTLDQDVIQCGGIPRGKIIEIYGPESSGKTTLALHIIAQEQKNTDNICAIIDAEHALSIDYAHLLGVNTDELIVSQPSSGEDALEIAEALVDSQAVSLIVIDSVAALVPRAELDGEAGDAVMGLQARLMSQACRKLVGKASTNNVSIIFINQLRQKIGIMFGNPETTTGGVALKFYASVRLDIRKKEIIGSKEQPTGHQLKIKCVKNKVGAPLRETTISLLYDSGIDTFSDFVGYALKLGVLEQAGPWVKFNGKNIGQGLTNACESVRLDSELLKQIKLAVDKGERTNEEIP